MSVRLCAHYSWVHSVHRMNSPFRYFKDFFPHSPFLFQCSSSPIPTHFPTYFPGKFELSTRKILALNLPSQIIRSAPNGLSLFLGEIASGSGSVSHSLPLRFFFSSSGLFRYPFRCFSFSRLWDFHLRLFGFLCFFIRRGVRVFWTETVTPDCIAKPASPTAMSGRAALESSR